jgi:hypothetical protein
VACTGKIRRQTKSMERLINNAPLDAIWFASLDSTIRVGKRDGACQIHAILHAVHLVARRTCRRTALPSC